MKVSSSERRITKRAISGFCALLISRAGSAYQSVEEFLQKTTLRGNLRSYYFTRDYANPDRMDQAAYSLGGYASVLTPPLFDVLQAGATVYSANSLGLNSSNPEAVDATLPGGSIIVSGEAFLQVKTKYLLLRGPDQVIDTPWIGPGEGRMMQSTFRAFYGSFTPTKDLTLVGLRLFDFKGRTEGNFTATNLYYSNHAGGSPVSGLTASAPGAQAVALRYGFDSTQAPLTAQLWWNQFFDFSKLLWLDAQYTYRARSGFNPLIGLQFASQWGDGSNLLEQAGQGPAGKTHALGVIVGVDMPFARLSFAYNKIWEQKGAFANGDLLSPYSTGYATDPLYTTSMIQGMIEKQAPGDAFKISTTWFFLGRQVKAMVSFAGLYTAPLAHDTQETNIDVTYSFPKTNALNGLSIRNRFGVLTGNISYGTFCYNRVQLQYSF